MNLEYKLSHYMYKNKQAFGSFPRQRSRTMLLHVIVARAPAARWAFINLYLVLKTTECRATPRGIRLLFVCVLLGEKNMDRLEEIQVGSVPYVTWMWWLKGLGCRFLKLETLIQVDKKYIFGRIQGVRKYMIKI